MYMDVCVHGNENQKENKFCILSDYRLWIFFLVISWFSITIMFIPFICAVDNSFAPDRSLIYWQILSGH